MSVQRDPSGSYFNKLIDKDYTFLVVNDSLFVRGNTTVTGNVENQAFSANNIVTSSNLTVSGNLSTETANVTQYVNPAQIAEPSPVFKGTIASISSSESIYIPILFTNIQNTEVVVGLGESHPFKVGDSVAVHYSIPQLTGLYTVTIVKGKNVTIETNITGLTSVSGGFMSYDPDTTHSTKVYANTSVLGEVLIENHNDVVNGNQLVEVIGDGYFELTVPHTYRGSTGGTVSNQVYNRLYVDSDNNLNFMNTEGNKLLSKPVLKTVNNTDTVTCKNGALDASVGEVVVSCDGTTGTITGFAITDGSIVAIPGIGDVTVTTNNQFSYNVVVPPTAKRVRVFSPVVFTTTQFSRDCTMSLSYNTGDIIRIYDTSVFGTIYANPPVQDNTLSASNQFQASTSLALSTNQINGHVQVLGDSLSFVPDIPIPDGSNCQLFGVSELNTQVFEVNDNTVNLVTRLQTLSSSVFSMDVVNTPLDDNGVYSVTGNVVLPTGTSGDTLELLPVGNVVVEANSNIYVINGHTKIVKNSEWEGLRWPVLSGSQVGVVQSGAGGKQTVASWDDHYLWGYPSNVDVVLDSVVTDINGEYNIESFTANGNVLTFNQEHYLVVGDDIGGGLTVANVTSNTEVVLSGTYSSDTIGGYYVYTNGTAMMYNLNGLLTVRTTDYEYLSSNALSVGGPELNPKAIFESEFGAETRSDHSSITRLILQDQLTHSLIGDSVAGGGTGYANLEIMFDRRLFVTDVEVEYVVTTPKNFVRMDVYRGTTVVNTSREIYVTDGFVSCNLNFPQYIEPYVAYTFVPVMVDKFGEGLDSLLPVGSMDAIGAAETGMISGGEFVFDTPFTNDYFILGSDSDQIDFVGFYTPSANIVTSMTGITDVYVLDNPLKQYQYTRYDIQAVTGFWVSTNDPRLACIHLTFGGQKLDSIDKTLGLGDSNRFVWWLLDQGDGTINLYDFLGGYVGNYTYSGSTVGVDGFTLNIIGASVTATEFWVDGTRFAKHPLNTPTQIVPNYSIQTYESQQAAVAIDLGSTASSGVVLNESFQSFNVLNQTTKTMFDLNVLLQGNDSLATFTMQIYNTLTVTDTTAPVRTVTQTVYLSSSYQLVNIPFEPIDLTGDQPFTIVFSEATNIVIWGTAERGSLGSVADDIVTTNNGDNLLFIMSVTVNGLSSARMQAENNLLLSWTQKGGVTVVTDTTTQTLDVFGEESMQGSGVATNGNLIVYGAPGYNHGEGRVLKWVENSGKWVSDGILGDTYVGTQTVTGNLDGDTVSTFTVSKSAIRKPNSRLLKFVGRYGDTTPVAHGLSVSNIVRVASVEGEAQLIDEYGDYGFSIGLDGFSTTNIGSTDYVDLKQLLVAFFVNKDVTGATAFFNGSKRLSRKTPVLVPASTDLTQLFFKRKMESYTVVLNNSGFIESINGFTVAYTSTVETVFDDIGVDLTESMGIELETDEIIVYEVTGGHGLVPNDVIVVSGTQYSVDAHNTDLQNPDIYNDDPVSQAEIYNPVVNFVLTQPIATGFSYYKLLSSDKLTLRATNNEVVYFEDGRWWINGVWSQSGSTGSVPGRQYFTPPKVAGWIPSRFVVAQSTRRLYGSFVSVGSDGVIAASAANESIELNNGLSYMGGTGLSKVVYDQGFAMGLYGSDLYVNGVFLVSGVEGFDFDGVNLVVARGLVVETYKHLLGSWFRNSVVNPPLDYGVSPIVDKGGVDIPDIFTGDWYLRLKFVYTGNETTLFPGVRVDSGVLYVNNVILGEDVTEGLHEIYIFGVGGLLKLGDRQASQSGVLVPDGTGDALDWDYGNAFAHVLGDVAAFDDGWVVADGQGGFSDRGVWLPLNGQVDRLSLHSNRLMIGNDIGSVLLVG